MKSRKSIFVYIAAISIVLLAQSTSWSANQQKAPHTEKVQDKPTVEATAHMEHVKKVLSKANNDIRAMKGRISMKLKKLKQTNRRNTETQNRKTMAKNFRQQKENQLLPGQGKSRTGRCRLPGLQYRQDKKGQAANSVRPVHKNRELKGCQRKV